MPVTLPLRSIASASQLVYRTYEGMVEELYKKKSTSNLYLSTIGLIVNPRFSVLLEPSVVIITGISENWNSS